MLEMRELAKEPLDEQYYAVAKMLFGKGYLLNTVMLLDEALGRYCLEGLRKLDSRAAKKIEIFENTIEEQTHYSPLYNRYMLGNQAKNIIKFGKKYNGKLFGDDSLIDKLAQKLEDKKYRKLNRYIRGCDALRNDLAHANSNKAYKDVKKEIENQLKKYQKICIEADPLDRFGG
jgi:hypothetical protein